MAMKRNPGLKPANKPVEYTRNNILELKRCMVDPVYFIKNYVYIKHPLLGKILFDMYDYQEEVINMYLNNRFTILLSARQTGKSETTCAFLLWEAIFHSEKTILIVSNKSSNAMELISKLQFAYEGLPEWLKPGINDNSWNKHEIAFDNNSRIIATTTSKNSGRGLSISRIYCDELAFVGNHIQQEFWDSIVPVISTGGSMIISSTPNGDINLFAQLWRGAELGTNEFKDSHKHIPWDAPPGRDAKFKAEMIGLLGERKWQQEYECDFLSESNTLIDSMIVTQLEKEIIKNLSNVTEFTINGNVFWKKIDRNATYLVSVDPATGSGEDYCVINVFEFPSLEQVMEWRNNTFSIPVIYTQLKNILLFLENYTQEIYFSVENNGVGQGILALYETDVAPPQKASLVSDTGKTKLGIVTTGATKLPTCLKLKTMIERRVFKLRSLVLIKELKSFIRRDGSYKAQTAATDDCISSLLLMIRMLEEMATYDDNAYEKLYTMHTSDQETWDYDSVDEYSMPMPVIIS